MHDTSKTHGEVLDETIRLQNGTKSAPGAHIHRRKGIDIPKVELNIVEGENLVPEFLKINPRGLLPTLELDDGTRVDEFMPICRYFEEIQADPPLLGRDARKIALVESRQRQMEFEGMIAGSEIFRNQHERFAERSIPAGGPDSIPAIPALVDRVAARPRAQA